MRKVFLKGFLIICFLIGFLAPISVNAIAAEPVSIEVTSGEEYTYEKIWIDGVLFIFVFDEAGKLIDTYPESCGGHHGGN
ncbi:MAG: hypothetical protein JST55_10685 [Bacteroidetes bacterium]|nr:hypothetical protein [Bacteroidota bacterium]